ncbi:NUDIX domain-containing protein [Paenibacillus roseipurpureus]|uniref:NUDIX domain-containing protein n=1 Tax=Paenibacillus roseopurpureus TaxID=2918901 RepID=A0AA96RPP5_9BACL|nr:NUDIX domain-containing protein [Paenibacillus sp. MBLB1832]WNR46867.1 NUDIX domain-containing protein [Paenibacillus sp. MBLB1832]
MKVRSGVKGIVIKNNSLLTIKKHDDKFEADYTLPGGGQEHGENLVEALQREFLEEVGCLIKVKQFVFLREYIGKNHHGNNLIDPKTHVVDHVFICEIVDEHNIGNGIAPDEDYIGIEWIPVTCLNEFRFFPKGLIKNIIEIANDEIPHGFYTGDIN